MGDCRTSPLTVMSSVHRATSHHICCRRVTTRTIQWLNSSRLVAWQQIGYMMIIYIAGLQAVPQDMLEAAKIDGAGGAQTLFKVIIPNVMPAITTCTFLTLTNGFKLFDQNLALTGGMPSLMMDGAKVNTTELLALNIFSTYNINKNYHGVAQAKAVIFFLLVAVLAIAQQAATRSKEVQQ